MDPDACFSMILEHIAQDEWIEAAYLAEALRDWMAKGGFHPGGGKLRASSIVDFLNWLVVHPNRGE